MAIKIDLKSLPPYARIIIAVLPSVVLVAAILVLAIAPKQKEIKVLDAKIDDQNNKIATSLAKSARLDALIKESEWLQARLKELKERLPEEKEISSLLKQVSDLAIASGLEMKSWKPGAKKPHPSGIVTETPVAITVSGTYHDFGRFLSSITKLSRIVNVDNIQASGAQNVRGVNTLQINFTATAYSSVEAAPAGAKKDEGKK